MEIAKSVLESAIKSVAGFSVKNRAVQEVHTMLWLHGEGDRLTVSASSPQVSARISFPQDDHEDISVLVSASRFVDVVSALPGNNVKLKVADNKLVVSSGKNRATLAIVSDVSMFPVIVAPNSITFTTQVDNLKAALDSVSFVADPRSSLIEQQCILIQSQGNQVLLGAAQRQRVAGARFDAEDEITGVHRSLITLDAFKAVIKVLKDYDNVNVTFDNGHVIFHTDYLVIDVITVAASFVDITKAENFPNLTQVAEFDSSEMLDAVRLVEVATKDDTLLAGSIRISINNGEIRFGARNAEDEGVAYCDGGIPNANMKEVGSLAQWVMEAAKGGELIKMYTNVEKPSSILFKAGNWFYMIGTMS